MVVVVTLMLIHVLPNVRIGDRTKVTRHYREEVGWLRERIFPHREVTARLAFDLTRFHLLWGLGITEGLRLPSTSRDSAF